MISTCSIKLKHDTTNTLYLFEEIVSTQQRTIVDLLSVAQLLCRVVRIISNRGSFHEKRLIYCFNELNKTLPCTYIHILSRKDLHKKPSSCAVFSQIKFVHTL